MQRSLLTVCMPACRRAMLRGTFVLAARVHPFRVIHPRVATVDETPSPNGAAAAERAWHAPCAAGTRQCIPACTHSLNRVGSSPGRILLAVSVLTFTRDARLFLWQVTTGLACLAASANAFAPCAVPAHTRPRPELSLRTSRGGASAMSMAMNTAESGSRR